MKALRSAMLPAAFAMSLLTGCGSYTRAWREQAEREQAKAAAEKRRDEPTVVQAGEPSETKRDVEAESKAQPSVEKEEAERETAEREKVAREKAEREEARGRAAAERAREEAARNPELSETREMRLWRLNQEQIDDLLDGDASDGHMLGMFLLSNDVDLSFAKLAYTRTENRDVKTFAKRMITDHTQMIATLKTLIEEHDIVPLDNMLARNLRDLASIQRDSLLVRNGAAFDRAYVAWEIENHREMMSMIDDVLLPRAGEGQLREMVASMRPVISAHLAHAEQLAESFGKR